MDSNYGLLSGIGQGLKEGFNSYIENERYKKDNALKTALTNMQLKQGGYQLDPDSGQLTQTDQGLQQDQLKSAQTAKDLAKTDPNSPESQTAREFKRGLIKSLNPKLDPSKIIPDNLSAADLESKGDLLPEYIKGLSGIQGREATNERVGRSNDIKQGFLELSGKRLGLQQNKVAGQVQEQVLSDPIIKQYTQTANQGARALSLFERPKMTYQELNDALIDYGKAISGSGAVTDSRLEATKFATAQGDIAKLQQYFTGQPTDAVPPEIKQRAQDLITDLQSTIAQQLENRAETKRKLFEGAPELNRAQDYAINKFKNSGLILKNPGIPENEWGALSSKGKKALMEKFSNGSAQ